MINSKSLDILNKDDLTKLIEFCKDNAKKGIGWLCEKSVDLSDLIIDFDENKERQSFLGKLNPAICINNKTYRYGKMQLGDNIPWSVNKTILLSNELFLPNWKLSFKLIDITGIVIHETGHAYNSAANIPNTEANAYLFEIFLLMKIYTENINIIGVFSRDDFTEYFQSRMSHYQKDFSGNEKLKQVVEILNKTFASPSKEVEIDVLGPKSSNFLFVPKRRKKGFDITTNPLLLFNEQIDPHHPMKTAKIENENFDPNMISKNK